MFANLNQGSLVHIVDLENGEYNTCVLESINYPNPYASNNTGMQNSGLFLTLRVNMNGKSINIEGVLAQSNISKTSKYIITDNRESMVEQLRSSLVSKTNIINNIDSIKQEAEMLEKALKQASPDYAKESDRDAAISTLSNRVDNIDDKLNQILNTLTSANNKTA